MISLENVCAAFSKLDLPKLGEAAHPRRETLVHARAIVREALASDRFLTDCITLDLQLMRSGLLRRGLTPFWTAPESGVRFAFGFWAPGGTPGPHEHTAWTITAVCRNRLEVATFDRAESYRRGELVPKNVFEAEAGQVGFICEPAIHGPKNTSSEWSLTLHITSPRDGEPTQDSKPLPGLNALAAALGSYDWSHPYVSVLHARERQHFLRLLVSTLASLESPDARTLLADCYNLGTTSTRRWIAQLVPMQEWTGPSPDFMTRSHEDLQLSTRRDQWGIAVIADTLRGQTPQVHVSDIALEALEYATAHRTFAVRTLPGKLSDEERAAIAEMLEETGLFHRVASE